MEDVTHHQQGPAPDLGGLLTLPLLPHPVLLPQRPLMSLAVKPGSLPRLVQAAEEELHPCPQGHCGQLSPQLPLVSPPPGLSVLGQEASGPLLVHPSLKLGVSLDDRVRWNGQC